MTPQNQTPRSREPIISRNALIAFVILALAVRFLWLIFGNPVIQEEGVYYARIAENLVKGKLFLCLDERKICLTEQPLFIFLIAGLNYFGINSELAGNLISLIFGSAFVVPMALITGRLYGRQVAYIAATLVALHPFLIGLSICVVSEMTYLFLLMSGLYFVYSSLDEKFFWRLSLSGMFFGLAYLTRVEGLALPFLAILFLCLIRRWSLRGLFLGSLAILTPFFVLAVPYILFLSIHAGHLAFEGKLKANYGRQMSILKGAPPEEFLFKIDDTSETQKA
jgi:4-amino-4-deoxy-L-arabinose transferase-like glycosyltransferase